MKIMNHEAQQIRNLLEIISSLAVQLILCQFCFTHDTLMKLTHITIDLNSCYSEMFKVKYEADRNTISYTITICSAAGQSGFMN